MEGLYRITLSSLALTNEHDMVTLSSDGACQVENCPTVLTDEPEQVLNYISSVNH